VVKVGNIVLRGLYRDSVQLMEATEALKKLRGVVDAAVYMGTESNKEMMRERGLLTGEGLSAGPNDIVIAVAAEGDVEPILAAGRQIVVGGKRPADRVTLEQALNMDLEFASISIPGRHVRRLAFPLLEKGVNMFIFSDHVPLDVEVELKRRASEKGLLVLGPEAGTAIVDGYGFGFANIVRKGPVGIVGSAGSGIQEVTSLLDAYGVGISHALGVGGRDLSEDVGGLMTAEALKRLERDPETKVIALVAKQSDEKTVEKILENMRLTKPLYLTLLGMHSSKVAGFQNIPTLHGLVLTLCKETNMEAYEEAVRSLEEEVEVLEKAVEKTGEPRGFYCGGTLATETAFIWKWLGMDVSSNIGVGWVRRIADNTRSQGPTIVDFGSEEFTEGRPHPIIDPTLRNQRVVQELNSGGAGIAVMDLIIGYGAPDNVVEKTVQQLTGVRSGRITLHVVGTPKDPQWGSLEQLSKLPAITARSNALAAAFAAASWLGDAKIISRVVKQMVVG
jgi:FdrA protein